LTDPAQSIDKRIREALREVAQPYTLIKKRDHYFVHIGAHPPICVGSNASRETDFAVAKAIRRIKKVTE
jgi:hypothetical protein